MTKIFLLLKFVVTKSFLWLNKFLWLKKCCDSVIVIVIVIVMLIIVTVVIVTVVIATEVIVTVVIVTETESETKHKIFKCDKIQKLKLWQN